MNLEQAQLKIKDYKKGDMIFHISHIDLDGYGSSYLIDRYLESNFLIQANTNYGEIIKTIDDIKVVKDSKVIITDLNLSIEESDYLNSITKNWIVIDHHGTGKDTAEKYPDNYFLDTTFCATYLTHMVFEESIDESFESAQLSAFVNIVNIYDTWKKSEVIEFNKGLLLTHLVYSNPFANSKLTLKYMYWLFDSVFTNIEEYGVEEVELQFPRRLLYWMQSTFEGDFLFDETLPMNAKQAYMHESVIKDYIVYEDEDLVIVTGISTRITQYTNDLMWEKPQYKGKVLINLNKEKQTIACRSQNETAVFYAKLFGGGGHPNAAGAKIEDTTPDNVLDVVVSKIQNFVPPLLG